MPSSDFLGMTKPTKKCKQTGMEHVHLCPEDLHMEIWMSLSSFVGICACVFVSVTLWKVERQSNLGVYLCV